MSSRKNPRITRCGQTPRSIPPQDQGTHDLVVVGASTGGVEALCGLVSNLPENFGAAVLIVMHIGPTSVLGEILSRCGPLPAREARDNEPLRRGQVYVAPPTYHMIVRDGHIALTRDAHENRHRPAIDPLFRSAARTYRNRVVGMVLSGALDDGTAGLFAIKKRGGVTIVQDPADAVMPTMPLNALRYTEVDHCVPLTKMGALITQLAGRRRKGSHTLIHPPKAGANASAKNIQGSSGQQVHFACPECSGPMYAVKNGKAVHFHCDVGHAFSPESLTEAHTEALERAIWIAIRALRERSAIQESLSRGYRTDRDIAGRFKATAKSAERDADLLEEILERL